MTEKSSEESAADSHAERQAADLAAIKGREARVRSEIESGGPVVDVGPFNMAQLGLTVPVVDRAGRLWRFDGAVLTRINL